MYDKRQTRDPLFEDKDCNVPELHLEFLFHTLNCHNWKIGSKVFTQLK